MKLITVSEAAKILKVKEGCVRNWKQRRKLPCVMKGYFVYFDEKVVRKFGKANGFR